MNDIKNDMPAANSGRRKIKNDIIFIAALLITVSLIGACVFFMRGEGDAVEVTVDGELYGKYLLSADTRVEIRTGEGDGQLNVLVIKDGYAYVELATCPDGICAGHKKISRDGESIVCLPHKVVITVYSSDESPDIIV